MEVIQTFITAGATVLVALVGIIPALISNRKNQKKDLEDFKKELTAAVKETSDRFDKFEKQYAADKVAEKHRDMKTVRYRILQFEADCRNPSIPYPAEGLFRDDADDQREYKAFLMSEAANGFSNGIAEEAMEYINNMYRKCKDGNLFGKCRGEQ